VLFDGVVESNPKPLIVIVAALARRFEVLVVTTGLTLATCTPEPLPRLFVVTTAVKLPIVSGDVSKPTVIDVAVDEMTVPTAPLLNEMVLFAAVVSKPSPAITTVAALAARLAVLLVTTGVIAAICVALPLFWLFVVTIAVRLPAVEGFVENDTVIDVGVADVMVPTALLFSVTALLATVGSNPKPLIVIVDAFAAT
jgi:hypothetical protein